MYMSDAHHLTWPPGRCCLAPLPGQVTLVTRTGAGRSTPPERLVAEDLLKT